MSEPVLDPEPETTEDDVARDEITLAELVEQAGDAAFEPVELEEVEL